MNAGIRLSALLATSILCLSPLFANAQGEDPSGQNRDPSKWADLPPGSLHKRWCLQGVFPVVSTHGRQAWRNPGIVELGGVPHGGTCTPRTIFYPGDELLVRERDGKVLLTIFGDKRKLVNKELLVPFPNEQNPQYWKTAVPVDNVNYYIFLVDVERSNPPGPGVKVKYYLVEAFDITAGGTCPQELPQNAMVELVGSAKCPTPTKSPTEPDDQIHTFQTDVGGGGEGK